MAAVYYFFELHPRLGQLFITKSGYSQHDSQLSYNTSYCACASILISFCGAKIKKAIILSIKSIAVAPSVHQITLWNNNTLCYEMLINSCYTCSQQEQSFSLYFHGDLFPAFAFSPFCFHCSLCLGMLRLDGVPGVCLTFNFLWQIVAIILLLESNYPVS